MPLSEEEQRILSEIEQRFYQEDPKLAREVAETTLYRHAAHIIRLATVGVVIGFIIMVTQFSSNPIIGFLGFVSIFTGIYVIWLNLRRIGKASWQEFMFALRSGTLGSQMRSSSDDVRHRFQRRQRGHDN